jgi:hypothetical protein
LTSAASAPLDVLARVKVRLGNKPNQGFVDLKVSEIALFIKIIGTITSSSTMIPIETFLPAR